MDFFQSQNMMQDTIQQGSHLGLERIRALLFQLGEPQKGLKYVHVAGTNGKGSIASMTANILVKAGYRTGLYTSPALSQFNERIVINGEMIDDETLYRLSARVKEAVFAIEKAGHSLPSEFEFVTAMAFCYYAEQHCDIVVLEVGLGGRLDATNVIDCPEVALIAALGMDHMAELGATLPLIAGEKAQIIKAGGHCVSYEQEPEAEAVLRARCKEVGASFTVPDSAAIVLKSRSLDGQIFDYKTYQELFIPLSGPHQLKNTAVVLEAVEILRARGFAISDAALREGLRTVVWHSRFEVIAKNPPIILDGAHNEHGVKALVSALEGLFPGEKLILATGILADKDYDDMLRRTSPLAACYITITPPNPRALSAAELAEHAKRYCADVTVGDSVSNALELALQKQKETGLPICCFGSLYMAGSIQAFFAGKGYGHENA